MAELVQHDTKKQQQQKKRGAGGAKREPAEEQQKGDVNTQLNAGDANDRD